MKVLNISLCHFPSGHMEEHEVSEFVTVPGCGTGIHECGSRMLNNLQSIEQSSTQRILYSTWQQGPCWEQPSQDGFPFPKRNFSSDKSVLFSLHQLCSWTLISYIHSISLFSTTLVIIFVRETHC